MIPRAPSLSLPSPGLAQANRAVFYVAHGRALAIIESGFLPDVVILDLNMPGLGGAGTLPRLRALLPTTPILLTTGRTDQIALDLVQSHSQVTLVSKPFSMMELQQHLEPLGRGFARKFFFVD
jgi:CheY-like chemotaxis protein